MPLIKPVTDPLKIVTDPVMLGELDRQGIDSAYVEFIQDYARREKGKSPYSKTYQDLKTGKLFMVVSGLPMVDADGLKIQVGWEYYDSKYYSKSNIFSARIEGKQVTLTVLSDQPNGTKAGAQVTWQPQLFLNDKEKSCGNAILLDIDPTNENYYQNVIEWDYGICKRRIRIIEGRFRERWIFTNNPKGEVRIKHNQSGDLRLKFGQFAINEDEELVPAEYFVNPLDGYPVEIGASLTVYPDAGTGNTTVDGHTAHAAEHASWATIHDGVGTAASDTADQLLVKWEADTAGANQFDWLYRSIATLDISGAAGGTATATVLDLYGYQKRDGKPWGDLTLNIYSSAPANDNALVAGDYNSLGTSAYATAIPYASFNVGTPGTVNQFTFNADPGLLAVTAALAGDGILRLGIREATYDAADATPTHAGGAYLYGEMSPWSVDKGEGYEPKIVITYQIDAEVVVPLADTINVAGIAPTATGTANVTVPLADTMNVAGIAPAVGGGALVTVPLASTIDMAGIVPVASGGASVTVPLAGTINVAGIAPALSAGVNIIVPLADTILIEGMEAPDPQGFEVDVEKRSTGSSYRGSTTVSFPDPLERWHRSTGRNE